MNILFYRQPVEGSRILKSGIVKINWTGHYLILFLAYVAFQLCIAYANSTLICIA